MGKYGKSLFRKHDADRYDAFIMAAIEAIQQKKEGKCARVNTSGLLPHDVVRLSEEKDPAAELMWHGLVQSVKRGNQWSGGCIPVCDVSGSMDGVPMEVAIALSMLLAESRPNDDPFRGRMFTFDSEPKLMTVPNIPNYETGDMGSLAERVQFVRNMGWGMNTNLEAVFEQLLALAQELQLTSEQVAQQSIVIFSDMEFDAALTPNEAGPVIWETMHEAICRKFAAVGYETLPTIVYWNLRSSSSIPAKADTLGVVLLSGFSEALLQIFLQRSLDDVSPAGMLRQLLQKRSYQSVNLAI
jgi:hypothetical protein